MFKLCYFLLVTLVCGFVDWGMNKPQYLLHLGSRKAVSENVGWGYWVKDSPLRMKYQTKELYAAMISHDGEYSFQEEVHDQRDGVDSNIRYLLGEKEWGCEIGMKGVEGMTSFLYFSVENNDYRLVDHEKYSSHITLTSRRFEDHVEVKSESVAGKAQLYQVWGEDLHVFGLTANVSETWTVEQIAQEFQHLVKVHEDPSTPRKQQEKMLQWEQGQLQLMAQDDWDGKKYVLLFVYGKVQTYKQIYITNSTTSKQFNNEAFQQKVEEFKELYSVKGLSPEHEKFFQHTIANLYGGMTFYFGRLYTQNSLILHRQDFSYTFTPSRLIFPRSFLWDDGFHQMVTVHYNPDLVMDMLEGWMRKIDMFGWVGREQIRGGEISAQMPDATYVFQDWFEMNPPTLLIPILHLINNPCPKTHNFLHTNFANLERWYRYLKSTQSHQSLEYPETLNNSIFYRWQCKDDCKRGNFMGSGLDDYPRTSNQTELSKQHVDIVSWLFFFSDSLSQVARELNTSKTPMHKQIKYYEQQAQHLRKTLFAEFLDEEDMLFKDVVVVAADAFVEKFVDKIGYINLFPFFTGMLRLKHGEEHCGKRVAALEKVLRVMKDERLLLGEDGLRSLSLSDQMYGTEENYWRGAVWMPINYLVLRACKLYYWEDSKVGSEVQELYHLLRSRLMETVYRNYEETGYLFENYHEGKGHRGHPFYGWTALIGNILSETY